MTQILKGWVRRMGKWARAAVTLLTRKISGSYGFWNSPGEGLDEAQSLMMRTAGMGYRLGMRLRVCICVVC